MNILLAVDGSEFTRHVLDYLVSHPAWLSSGNRVVALTVVPPVPPRAAAVLSPEVLKEYYDDAAETVLGPVRRMLTEKGVQAECQHRIGHAAAEIGKAAADQSCDLIVMGSHGHGSLSNLVMGSVVTKVLAGCKTPVLIVR